MRSTVLTEMETRIRTGETDPGLSFLDSIVNEIPTVWITRPGDGLGVSPVLASLACHEDICLIGIGLFDDAGSPSIGERAKNVVNRRVFIFQWHSSEPARVTTRVGKWALPPQTLALANEVFTPSDEMVAQAQRILDAMETAQNEGSGAVTLDGKLIDLASIRQAQVIVRQAELVGSSG